MQNAVHVLCYYPHHNGTMVSEGEIDFTLLLMLLHTAEDEQAETDEIEQRKLKSIEKLKITTTVEELFNGIDMHDEPAWHDQFTSEEHDVLNKLVTVNGNMWGFSDLIRGGGYANSKELERNVKKVLHNLKWKGWHVAEWEEGTTGIAFPGFEDAMKAKIRKIESEHAADEMDF